MGTINDAPLAEIIDMNSDSNVLESESRNVIKNTQIEDDADAVKDSHEESLEDIGEAINITTPQIKSIDEGVRLLSL